MNTGKDETKKALALFGPVLFHTNPVTMTICGIAKMRGSIQRLPEPLSSLGKILTSIILSACGDHRTMRAQI